MKWEKVPSGAVSTGSTVARTYSGVPGRFVTRTRCQGAAFRADPASRRAERDRKQPAHHHQAPARLSHDFSPAGMGKIPRPYRCVTDGRAVVEENLPWQRD